MITLAFLGLAWRRDPSVRWLENALALRGVLRSPAPTVRFEVELDSALLNESPLVSTIDFLVEDEAAVICVEAKFGKDGMGRCSCPQGAPAVANCSQRLLRRPLYWETAREVFFLPDRVPGKPCPTSSSYQTIRNAAAARALADEGRRAVFVLVHDDRNPYFHAVNRWPGWPELLTRTSKDAERLERLWFLAVSWQELSRQLPLEEGALEWAREKHALA